MLFNDLKTRIENKEYSLHECQDMLNAFLMKKQLTSDEYSQLMDLAMLNTDIENEYPELHEQVNALGIEIEEIKKRLEKLEGNEPSPEIQEWQQWNGLPYGAGGVGIYTKGEKVKRNEQIYESTIDNNTYDPLTVDERVWKKVGGN